MAEDTLTSDDSGQRVGTQVLKSFFKFFKELDSGVKVTIAGIGIHNWSRRLTMLYNQLFARALGANPVELGLLDSIGTVASSTVSVPIGWTAEKYSVKKVMLFGLACTFIVAIIYALASNWWMLIPALILGGMVRINPLADIILIKYTKPEQSGTVIGFSRTIWAIPRIFAPLIAAAIVAHFGGINVQGIRPLYCVQMVLTIFVLLFMAMKLRTPPNYVERKNDTLSSNGAGFIQDFREFFKGGKWLKRWMILMIIRSFGQRLAVPFMPLWVVEVKGADPYVLGIIGTLGTMMWVFLQIPVGSLADKIGRKKVYFLLRPIMYLGTFLLILAPSSEYLVIVGLLGTVGLGGEGGGIGGLSFTPFITMQWEMVPDEKRGRWFGIEGLINVFSIPATLLGGIMWQQGFMIEVLLLPILLEALVTIPLLISIPDTLNR